MMPLMQNWVVRKPVAISRGGIVASANGSPPRSALTCWRAGGSAVDAVVATAFALAVREPWNSGLGGIGSWSCSRPAGRAPRWSISARSRIRSRSAAYPLTGEMRTELFIGPRVEGDRQHARAAFSRSPERGARLCDGGGAVRPYAVRDLVARRWHWPVPIAGRLYVTLKTPTPPRICAVMTRAARLAAGRSAAGLPASASRRR